MTRRIVVTGAGVVTALGYELADFWERLCAGKSGVGPLKRFQTTDFKVTFGGEIRDFVPEEHLDLVDKEIRRLDRFVQFAMVASHRAVQSSGIDFNQGDPYRHGTLIGSGIGGLHEIEEQHAKLYERGPSRVSPFMIPKLIVNAASGNVSIRWQLRGPSSAIATACATANQRHRRRVSPDSARQCRRDAGRRQRSRHHADVSLGLRPDERSLDSQR